MIRTTTSFAGAVLGLLIALSACGGGSDGGGEPDSTGTPAASGLPDSVFLSEIPADAKPLSAVKGGAAKGDSVQFAARIGGRAEPFVDSRAIMVVIDPALPSCADIEGDNCPVPWDYCCETPESLVENTATVQFVDAAGKPLAVTLKGQNGLKELDWITVVGDVAEKDDSGLFVVNATGLYIGKS